MEIQQLQLSEKLLKAASDLGFTEATPIQEKCIPAILQGKDVFGHSSTGSGKTAAFGLPMLDILQPKRELQALILTPTRELCVQVTDSLKDFSKYTHFSITSVYGGVGIEPQIRALRTADIVVGTPGRIMDHIQRNTINLKKLKFFVLDEADKMFEMGFIEAVEEIVQYIPQQRQTLLFSATLPESVKKIIKRHMKDPVVLETERYVDKSLLKQVYYNIQNNEKFSLLVHLLKKETQGLAIVFCATRHEASLLARNLKQQGLNVMEIHGGLSQRRREDALHALKHEDINILVATDVAARGLDIKNVSHVYNYDVPKTADDYVHRIGRTARAGVSGDAVTLLTERDHDNFRKVLWNNTIEIKRAEIPQFERVFFKRAEEQQRGGNQRFQRRGSWQGQERPRGNSFHPKSRPHRTWSGRR